MPLGPAQSYLAKYNTFILPGYVQSESFDSIANIADHYAPFADGSLSEYTGLQNKQLVLRLKVWETDYATAKEAVELAATYLRTKRDGFAPLYVQRTDRYYDAMTPRITTDKSVGGTSYRTLEYEASFECKPWVTSVSGHSLSGSGTIDTDSVARTIDNGFWTPAIVTVTGTDVTVSGYTETGDFAGFISVSGAATGLVLDTENFTATIGGLNKNNLMYSADYRMYVGPGKTSFDVTGGSVTITYYDRWPL